MRVTLSASVPLTRICSRWKHTPFVKGQTSGASTASRTVKVSANEPWRLLKNLSTSRKLQSSLSVNPPDFIFIAMISPPGCWASETVTYNPSSGNSFLVNLAGAGYLLLVVYFLYRVLTKRAKRFREEKLAGRPSELEAIDPNGQKKTENQRKKITILDGLTGIMQSCVLTVGLFIFTTKVDTRLLSTALPEQYTAHNIAVAVRTIIRGLCYLFTFVFAMNCIGLSGLTIKLALDPDSVNNMLESDTDDTKPQLPRISVVSKPEDVIKAFDKVGHRGKDKNK